MLRKVLFATVLIGLSSVYTTVVSAAGDAQKGQEKSAVCAACHGPTGISNLPINPNIAGQVPGYIEMQLKAFKSGARVNPVMAGQAAILSDEDMADLDAFYSSQEPNYDMPMTEEDKELAAEGGKIYRGGFQERGIINHRGEHPAARHCHQSCRYSMSANVEHVKTEMLIIQPEDIQDIAGQLLTGNKLPGHTNII